MIRTLIIEDSRLARLELRALLAPHTDVEVVGEADGADAAISLIGREHPDLLLLDIHLPGKNGFELLQELHDVPAVIFTTAFDQYALQAFDHNAIDYLLKPISPERLQVALQKAAKQIGAGNQRPAATLNISSRIFIKDGDRCWFVALADVSLLEAKGNYTKVHFNGNAPLILKSLQQLEEVLDPSAFIRINRQQVVNVNFISSVDEGLGATLKLTLKSGLLIEASRRRVRRVRACFSL